MNKFKDQTKHYQSYLHIGYAWAVIVLIMLLLTSCYVYESTYSPQKHNCELMARGDVCLSDHRCCNPQEHTTQVYYYDNLPYWGFYNDYYYYYGIPHMYPWWYYYTIWPHHTYNVSTHVYITCNTGYYIGKPRGPKFTNNRGGTFKPTNTVVVKPNRSGNRPIRTNTNRNNVKVNTNKVKINTTNRTNNNRNNVKVNTNKNKVNNKSNVNRNNNKVKNNNTKRSNKSKIRKPR